MAPERPKIRADLEVAEIDGEGLVFDKPAELIHYLNPTATALFQLCDGKATVEETGAAMAEAFGIPLEDAVRHVRILVGGFYSAGMLEGDQARAHVTKEAEIDERGRVRLHVEPGG
jgi:hypothetical protein